MDVILGKHFIGIHVQNLIRFLGVKIGSKGTTNKMMKSVPIPESQILQSSIIYRLSTLCFQWRLQVTYSTTCYYIFIWMVNQMTMSLHNFRKEFPMILRYKCSFGMTNGHGAPTTRFINKIILFCLQKKEENNWILLKSWKFIVFHLHAHIYKCDMPLVLRHHQRQSFINGFFVQTPILLGNSIINSKVPFEFGRYKTVSGLWSFVMCDAICWCRRECNCN